MKSLPLAALAAALALPARGAETAQFLNIGAGARGLSMGGAYTALADDASALYWNPAGLAALPKKEFQATHSELARSTRHDFLAFASPSPAGTLAAGLTYLSYGAIDGRDAQGRETGDFHASGAAAALGYARSLGPWNLGLAVKYIRSHIGSAEADTVGGDAGVQRSFGRLSLGAAVRNVGPGLKFDNERNDLPLRVSAGGAYKFAGGHAFTAELIDGPRGTGLDGAVGAEYQVVPSVFFRGGYSSQYAVSGGTGFNAVSGLTLGLGYRDARWELAYAVLPMGDLGDTHRFTLGARF